MSQAEKTAPDVEAIESGTRIPISDQTIGDPKRDFNTRIQKTQVLKALEIGGP